MADTTVESLGEGVGTLDIATENGTEKTPNGPADDWDAQFGFPLPDLFKLAARFYRGDQMPSDTFGSNNNNAMLTCLTLDLRVFCLRLCRTTLMWIHH